MSESASLDNYDIIDARCFAPTGTSDYPISPQTQFEFLGVGVHKTSNKLAMLMSGSAPDELVEVVPSSVHAV